MLQRVDADLAEATKVEFLKVVGARLQDHLILIISAEPVGVLAVAAVGWAAARLDVSGPPRVGPKRAQHGGRMEGPCPHLHVIRLEDHAALIAPIAVEREDQVLEAQAQAKWPRLDFVQAALAAGPANGKPPREPSSNRQACGPKCYAPLGTI